MKATKILQLIIIMTVIAFAASAVSFKNYSCDRVMKPEAVKKILVKHMALYY